MKRITLFHVLVLCLVLLLTSGIYLVARLDKSTGAYTPKDKEYYLSPAQLLFIRPGLELEIMNVTIPEDRKPVVELALTDPGGLPLDRDGVFTPGPISISGILAYIPAGQTAYVGYTTRVQTSPITGDSAEQVSSEGNATVEKIGDGLYRYTFGTALPADYDADATHTVGFYVRRDLREFGLDRYVDNQLHDWVPSGAGAPVIRDIVTTVTCNKCHDPLALHGGSRQEIQLCVLCHNSTQDIDPDTGNSVDMKIMIHKIHMGAELPSVQAGTPYQIIGYRQSVHDYSEVEFPTDIRDCEMCHMPGMGGTAPLMIEPNPIPVCDGSGLAAVDLTWSTSAANVEIRVTGPNGVLFTKGKGSGTASTGKWVKDGLTFYAVDAATGAVLGQATAYTTVFGCVGDAPGAPQGVAASQWDTWLTNPSREACGSCHDNVNFATGQGHSIGIPQDNDNFCGVCHPAGGDQEYDISIRGAHTVPYKSRQLNGVLIKILSITDTAPGQTPTVEFTLASKKGPLNPAQLGRLRFAIAGPNDDYSWYSGLEDATGSLVKVGDHWAYTFQTPLPDDAEGSFTVGTEGRINSVILNPGTENEIDVRDQAQNSVLAFPVTDLSAVPRREIVTDQKCEACHGNLSIHGQNRHDPLYCNTCHQPAATDEEVRLEGPPESIHLKYMIHKLHTGAELERGYVVYGYRSSVHDYGHLEFPGDLRNCEKCHVNDSYMLPLADGVLPTITNWDFFSPTEPIAAACLSCHDSRDAAAHADTMTSAIVGESCAACHGTGADYSVERVHAR